MSQVFTIPHTKLCDICTKVMHKNRTGFNCEGCGFKDDNY